MNGETVRLIFGALAFAIAAAVIALVLSPLVPPDKEAISNLVAGNVLGWPATVLAYHYGTSAGSVRKTELMGKNEEDQP